MNILGSENYVKGLKTNSYQLPSIGKYLKQDSV